MQDQKRLQELAVEIRDILSKLTKCQKKSQREGLVFDGKIKSDQLKKCIDELPEFNIHRKRLEGELKKINQTLDKQAEKNLHYSEKSQSFVRVEQEKPRITERDSKRAILSKMIEIEMNPVDLKIKPQEIEKIADEMEKNYEIMRDIQELIQKDGRNLYVATENILYTIENVKKTEKQIEEADKAQLQGIMLKVRLGIGSILALIGNKIFGVAGGVAGFFTGFFGFK